MRFGLLHDQDEDGIAVKGERPIKGFVGATGSRCGIIGTSLRIKPNLNRIRGTGLKDREDGQKDLNKRFSRSTYLEEHHKHQKGKYVYFRLAKATMSVNPSTSSSTAAAGTSEVPTRDFNTPPPPLPLFPPSIHAPRPTSPLLNPIDGAPPSSRDAI
ncbi:hypothetical protein M9H77_09235 [Catharanthus roseus]|uniref:Uncharacterized protein n=1 Tax=Catharanthus roseus TaxID=4058 RepID=A0ACC0C071_CATRO|nr:hypothetical protein M9H77_09235 [Catharanthus roseus]